jgi:pilus assembly protein TadC
MKQLNVQIMETENPGFFAEVKDVTEKYIQDRLLLLKLEASEKVAGITSRVYIVLPLAFLLFFILALVTFLAGYYLSVWLGGYWIGFGIMLIIYVLAFFLIINLHKKRLKKFVADKVVESIFSE